MSKKLLLLCLAFFISPASAGEPRYAVESLAAIIRELSQDTYEEPVKAWLKEHRADEFERLFDSSETSAAKESDEEGEDRGLLSSLAELGAAIAKPQAALLDYYINQKAEDGWEVISLTDSLILFRKADPEAEPSGADIE